MIRSVDMKQLAAMAILLFVTASADISAAAEQAVRVIPKPVKVEMGEGNYVVDASTVIYVKPATAEMKAVGKYLADLLSPPTGLKPAIKSPWFSKTSGIVLKLDASKRALGDEGYSLNCTKTGVIITAAKPAGIFYGVQTLRQLLPVQVENRQKVDGVEWAVPCVSIEDQPRFKWRGYLIDPARQFRTKEELKRYIDLLALQKLNIMQIHLTDDQGWRVEIKKYPGLVETGSRLPDYGGKKGEGWFYSQADIRELVAFASSRYVTIVPEIEMPGHSGAAIASYPDLGCGGKHPGGWSCPLCVTRKSALEYATNVLDEVISLFPSAYIHVGADEVPPGPWRGCASCKPAMEKLAGEKLPEDVISFRVNLTRAAGLPFNEDIGRLQGEFIRKIDQHLAARGRRMLGWDEILEGGLKAGSPAAVMAWRGSSAVGGATGQKRDVIVTLYPDYYLDNDTTLKGTYEYEPVPKDLPSGQEKYVLGVQGNMWGEHTQTIQHVDRRSFPRLCAIAESGWSLRQNRNFEDFSSRLAAFCSRLDLLGVNYRKP